ncbi:MAG: AraC family transcriptional regulator [Bacteroidia bacterium]|jgi:AraC-like DNA-binding protein
MNKPDPIAQHPLLNQEGNPVQFRIDDWGEMHDYSYDYLKAHRHNFYEIMVFEKGNAQHDIDFTSFAAKSSSVHFVAPDNVHLLLREKNSTGFSIQFTGGYFSDEVLEKLPFNANPPLLKLTKEELKKVLYLVEQIRTELAQNFNLRNSIVCAHAEAVMILLARRAAASNTGETGAPLSPHVEHFKNLVKLHFTQHHTVAHYAGLLSISPKHLIEICKTQTGKTPLKLIQDVLISEAKRQLFHTSHSIKEIAYALGFDDPANFSKYFKAATGYSPLAYRQETGK